MPIAFRLYLPESWAHDRQRRKKTGVQDSIQFQTKPEIALEQIRRARASEASRKVWYWRIGSQVNSRNQRRDAKIPGPAS